LDEEEPEGIARAVALLGLSYVVITCVARDDLADGGAGHMARTIGALREQCPGVGVEVLISDYRGSADSLRTVLEASPTVLSYNLETVERLQRSVRSSAGYVRSLELLERAHMTYPSIPTKSGLMLGIGETRGEIDTALRDLVARGVSLLTIGQYLRPSPKHLPVARYVHPDEFSHWERRARELGFHEVASGPLVRSSYRAERLMRWKSETSGLRVI
jgi:lipoic acid synthetase